MDIDDALLALAALAHGTRLEAFRALVAEEPGGLAAGEVARRLAVPHNTLSTHLAVLARAGLVRAERRSRSIIYRANPGRARALAAFLLQDCCGGQPEMCGPPVAVSSPRRQPTEA
ncbi:MAG TPA: metalloregulator ArsR/SmtB family transcription factor [Salinarimonas sp.]|nr:metalloregulator ArsR/SmtB family transcription factor [Salinarimonas sp.]